MFELQTSSFPVGNRTSHARYTRAAPACQTRIKNKDVFEPAVPLVKTSIENMLLKGTPYLLNK